MHISLQGESVTLKFFLYKNKDKVMAKLFFKKIPRTFYLHLFTAWSKSTEGIEGSNQLSKLEETNKQYVVTQTPFEYTDRSWIFEGTMKGDMLLKGFWLHRVPLNEYRLPCGAVGEKQHMRRGSGSGQAEGVGYPTNQSIPSFPWAAALEPEILGSENRELTTLCRRKRKKTVFFWGWGWPSPEFWNRGYVRIFPLLFLYLLPTRPPDLGDQALWVGSPPPCSAPPSSQCPVTHCIGPPPSLPVFKTNNRLLPRRHSF